MCVCVNGPGGGGCMPPALCINLNLLVCLVGKLCVPCREGRVFAPGLRYTQAEKKGGCIVGVQQALYTSFVPPLGLNFCRAVRRDRQRVSLYSFPDILHKKEGYKVFFKKYPAEEMRADCFI